MVMADNDAICLNRLALTKITLYFEVLISHFHRRVKPKNICPLREVVSNIDRDGVINFDSDNYIKSPDEWIPYSWQLRKPL